MLSTKQSLTNEIIHVLVGNSIIYVHGIKGYLILILVINDASWGLISISFSTEIKKEPELLIFKLIKNVFFFFF
jgi:hypothetical protein